MVGAMLPWESWYLKSSSDPRITRPSMVCKAESQVVSHESWWVYHTIRIRILLTTIANEEISLASRSSHERSLRTTLMVVTYRHILKNEAGCNQTAFSKSMTETLSILATPEILPGQLTTISSVLISVRVTSLLCRAARPRELLFSVYFCAGVEILGLSICPLQDCEEAVSQMVVAECMLVWNCVDWETQVGMCDESWQDFFGVGCAVALGK